MTEGVRYWLDRLRPYAAAGYRTGYVTRAAVVLMRGDERVVLRRPGRRWIGGPDLDAVLEEDREEPDPEIVEGFKRLRFLEAGGEG